VLEQEAELFPVRKAWWYIQRAPLGFGMKASQGASFFVAPNPPFGATFTYYLKESIETKKQARREKEKKIEKKGGDTPTPGWEALREEDLELEPAIVLTIRDAAGEVVRQITGPTKKGIHRVSWSLTYPSTDAQQVESGGEEGRRRGRGDPNDGGLVAPGTYSVSLGKRVDGKLNDLGKSQKFEVVPLRDGGTLPGMTPEERGKFEREYAELSRQFTGARAVLRDTKQRVESIRKALDRATVDDTELRTTARDLELRLAALEEELNGNERRGTFNDEGPVSISDRFGKAGGSLRRTLGGPTETQTMSFEIAKRRFAEFRDKLHAIATDELPKLESKLEEARIPWTPGRTIPGK
jgi:hypothetical protein